MSPIGMIANWAQSKPVWWKHALKLALTNGTLDKSDLNDVLRIALTEHGLVEPNERFKESTKPLDFTGYTTEQYEVSIKSLYDVKGVGLLAENQTITFPDNGLFIIYGDNGSGKSSYASILKNVCLTRGVPPQVVGNVFAQNSPSPQAKISVSYNKQDEIYLWNKDKPSSETLKSIRVFDSDSATHYVNKEDALGFKPVGLNLLNELVKAVNNVNAYVSENTMPGNGLVKLTELSSSSITAKFVNNLSADTNESEISKHIITTENLQKIEPLRIEIFKYKSQTAESIRNNLQQKKLILEPLSIYLDNTLKLLDDKALIIYKELKLEKKRTEKLSEELRKVILDDLPLDGIAGLNWQNLWQAAKKFIEQESNKNSFPLIRGAHCPLCLQEIGEESENRMARLNEYLSNEAEKNAKLAKNNFDKSTTLIKSTSLNLSSYQAAITLLNKQYALFGDELTLLHKKLEERKEIILNDGDAPLPIITNDSLDKLKKIILEIDSEIKKIGSDEDLLALIAKKEETLSHFEDMKYVLENIENIKSNIKRYKIIKSLEKIKSQCGTKSISTLSSKIYHDGVVEPLISAFNNELKSFGFDRFKIKVDSRNKSGVQQFKLSLADEDNNIVGALDVTSEGEQRCIAIASFLAEMIADSRKSAIIFDDPVNSLSHEWSSRVANRLVQESKNRQVIVLTHNIVFYKLLLEVAEKIEAQHSSIALERSRKFAGLVKESPPWEGMTTNSRCKALKVKLQELKKLESNDDTTIPELRRAFYQFYGYLRETWERLVEEKLLNKVVTRFERGISTQRLARLTDICQDDIDKVNDAMSKCSTYFRGHDSAPAIADPYPTITEIEQDLEAITSFLAELEAKPRKRN
ncbi:AAA family ATPase [Morganella morganii]|uniref:AAA family ATPase n=1 Tax=Morganella morganii TaxID=582 RepID=UPI00288A864B|nr:AAA family ATPase [Morganella morganii]WNJ24511.1 AAA family ATPase [Morganella morganii]